MKLTFSPPQFPCTNCGQPIHPSRVVKLFCADLCKNEADYVRYHRRCILDGRVDQPDIQFALRTKRAFILSGGYSSKERHLPNKIRDLVLQRNKGLCQVCGKAGTEIDHINGSNDELSNLQLLCQKCHNEKTALSLKPLDKNDPQYDKNVRKAEELNVRVHAIDPLQECDDQDQWPNTYRTILNQRKQEYYQAVGMALLPLVEQSLSARKIAVLLNGQNIVTFSGNGKWEHKAVSKIMKIVDSKQSDKTE